jgi:hypothetical protein
MREIDDQIWSNSRWCSKRNTSCIRPLSSISLSAIRRFYRLPVAANNFSVD